MYACMCPCVVVVYCYYLRSLYFSQVDRHCCLLAVAGRTQLSQKWMCACVCVCVHVCVCACVRACVREMCMCRQYFVTIRIDAAHCYLTTLVLYSCSTIWNTLITCECAILGMPGLVLVTSYLSAVRPVCAQSVLFLLRDSTFSAV